MKSFVVWAGLLLMAGPALGYGNYFDVDELVTALNSAPLRQQLGVRTVSRPQDSVNRLEVVFEETTPAGQRQQTLKDIGNEFLRLLFERTGITTVTIRERNAQGEILDQAIVSFETPVQLRR